MFASSPLAHNVDARPRILTRHGWRMPPPMRCRRRRALRGYLEPLARTAEMPP